MSKIFLSNNQLSALHPQMFSHLAILCYLDLEHNTCINETFCSNPSKATIEDELAACGVNYQREEQLKEFSEISIAK